MPMIHESSFYEKEGLDFLTSLIVKVILYLNIIFFNLITSQENDLKKRTPFSKSTVFLIMNKTTIIIHVLKTTEGGRSGNRLSRHRTY